MFTISKRLNKLLACFLTALTLMSNSVALVPVYAAANAQTSEQNRELPEITLDKQVEAQSQIKQNEDTANLTTKQKVVQFLNQLIPYYAQSGKQQGPEWLRTTDINFTFAEDFKPIYSLETIQPFTNKVVDGKLGFWQGRYAYQSGANSTANLGIGFRWLSEDKTSITGINTFYDYAFKHNLSRVGIGAEYFNKQTEYRANFYIPTSGDRQTGTTALPGGMLYSYIRAVSGFDYEVGSTLANAPWLGFYASGFHYDNKHKEDENGYRLRSKMQLTPRLSMEMGYTNSNLTSGSLYGKILYQLADAAGPALHGGNAEEMSKDISYKLLQKVQRENDIKTETFTKLVIHTGKLSVTVTNNGAALQGAQVQAYQNGSPVGTAAVTDANGIALLSGLTTGDYTVRATYFSTSGNSPAVSVVKDQTTNTTISLAVVGGRAIINVLDNAGAGIGGATVTAEAVGGLHGAADKSFFDRIFGTKTAYAAAAFTVTAVTDANGVARFDNLPPGNYKFTVTNNGKEMKSLAVAVPEGLTSNATVVLPASGGNIVAMVSDAISEAAIAEAAVELKNGSTVIETKSTGSDGTVVFSGLTAGSTYTVTASAANYISKNISTTVTDKETVAAAIALTPQAGGANITVNDASNAPLSGATVSVTVNGQEQTMTTDANGVAAFTNLATGTYTFTATKADYNSNTASATISGGSIAAAAVTLTRQTGNAKITVTDGTLPLSGATVSVTVNGQAQTATTAANGEATFTNIPTGTYTFTATKSDYESGTANDVAITVGATATSTIALAHQTGSAKITVTDGTLLLSGATVSVTVNGQEQIATTVANGEATFTNIPTGTYTFTATKSGYGSGTSNGLTIAKGATATATVALTRQTGNAKITVTDGTAPLSDVTVSVTLNGQAQTAITAANGEATFTNIPAGTYTFTATKADYGSGTANDVVIANGTTATATIALTRQTGGAKITVTDGALPLVGATVSVTVNGQAQTATTTANGEATFTNIPTGTYTFTATKPDYGSATANDVVIASGETATKTIALTRQTGSAKINVTDGDNPISGITVNVTVNGQVKTETTNAQGEVTFTSIPTGQYTFTATSGFASNTADVAIAADAMTSKTILLPAMGSVSFTVTNGSGPISGAKISVTVSGNTIDKYSGADGKASFVNLPVGNYTFEVTSTGYESKSQSVTIARNTTGNVDLIINKIITVQVHVKDSAGNNVYQPSVRITGTGVDETIPADYTGKATFNVPAGTYVFTATKNEYNSDSKTVSISDANKSVELTLVHKVGNVTFTVKDKEGRPISGATIGKSYDTIVYGTTDANGELSVNDMPTNVTTQMHWFDIRKDGYQGITQGVTVNEGDNAVEVALDRLPGKARVTVKSGATILEGATVLAAGSSKVTNMYGRVTFESITSGEVAFTAGMPGYASKTITATIPHGNTYTDVEINLTALDPATLVTLTVNSNYDPALNNVVLYLRDENGFDIAFSSKTGSQIIFSGLAPNKPYTIIGKYFGVYRSEFDQGVNMGSTDRTVAYNKFQ